MTLTSIIFFAIGTTVLWGGFIIFLVMLIKSERKNINN
ncbi:MAG: MetS family NSS transporter small subunit [Sarcina sp.]